MNQRIFLQPGEFFFGKHACVETLLGSCVAVTMWHPKLKVGGMCHFVLATRNAEISASGKLDTRYGDEAMAMFCRCVQRRGAPREEYRVSIFGGANMFGSHAIGAREIGQQNVQFAQRWLEQRGYKISQQHIGGGAHRRVVLDLDEGDAKLVERSQVIKGAA